MCAIEAGRKPREISIGAVDDGVKREDRPSSMARTPVAAQFVFINYIVVYTYVLFSCRNFGASPVTTAELRHSVPPPDGRRIEVSHAAADHKGLWLFISREVDAS